MSIRICPRCQQRYVVAKRNDDFVHQCNSGNDTLDQEDIVVIGDWEDYTGSAIVPPSNNMTQGLEAKNFGRRSWIEGIKVSSYTSRGNRSETHRQRQHLQFIEGEVEENE